MNYLKKFNEIKSDDIPIIEELSEYLQEFFDNNGIPQGDYKKHGNIQPSDGFSWYVLNWKNPLLLIVNIPEKMQKKLKSEIDSIRPLIETRINNIIKIDDYRTHITIGLK